VGQIFTALIDKWGENTGTNIVKQIKEWNAEDALKDTNTDAPTPYQFKK